MERNEQDQVLSLAEKCGVEPEWADHGDGTGHLEFCGTSAGFVSFTEAYTKSEWNQREVHKLLKSCSFSEDLVEGDMEFTGTPDSFWAFVSCLK